jgi:DNA modification methylase
MGFDLELTGFELDEITALQVEQIEPGLTDEDAVPEVPETPVTVEGDVWLLGRHRLMCGDSNSIDAVERLMSGHKADMVFTDPMYNDKTAGFTNTISSLGIEHIVLMTTFKQAISILSETEWHFNFDTVLYFKTPSSMMNKAVPYYLHKNVFYVTARKDIKSIFNCDNATGVFSENGYYPSVIEAKKNTQEQHGLTKPVDAIVKLMSGYKAKTIIDLFGGSGSTLIACEKTNRNCRMMELDPKYCDVIIKRWQDFTGKQAVHADTGKTFAEVGNEQA